MNVCSNFYKCLSFHAFNGSEYSNGAFEYLDLWIFVGFNGSVFMFCSVRS